MSYEQHQQSSKQIIARCAIVTLSDTRTIDTDKSGARIKELLTQAGHTIESYKLIPDDAVELETILQLLLPRDDIDVVLTNGGTGIARRDNTIPVIDRHLEIHLPGFGELFRMLSYEQIASGAMLSRAIGGISNGKFLFAMPGSTKAVELAMTKLILPELGHLLGELRKP